MTAGEIAAVLKAKGFSNLANPKEVKVVKEIPKLGTGKPDYRRLIEMLKNKHSLQSPRPAAASRLKPSKRLRKGSPKTTRKRIKADSKLG